MWTKIGAILAPFSLLFLQVADVSADTIQVWSFTSESTKARCNTKPSTLQVKNNRISGSIVTNTVGKVVVSGRVNADGTFNGTMAGGLASFTGTFSGTTGSGTWQDVTGCSGTMTVRRLE